MNKKRIIYILHVYMFIIVVIVIIIIICYDHFINDTLSLIHGRTTSSMARAK
jgi:hypothetical protein